MWSAISLRAPGSRRTAEAARCSSIHPAWALPVPADVSTTTPAGAGDRVGEALGHVRAAWAGAAAAGPSPTPARARWTAADRPGRRRAGPRRPWWRTRRRGAPTTTRRSVRNGGVWAASTSGPMSYPLSSAPAWASTVISSTISDRSPSPTSSRTRVETASPRRTSSLPFTRCTGALQVDVHAAASTAAMTSATRRPLRTSWARRTRQPRAMPRACAAMVPSPAVARSTSRRFQRNRLLDAERNTG